MTDEHALVLVAGYPDLAAARGDFDTLTELVKGKRFELTGAVLVGKDADGKPVLIDTGNRVGRRGAAWGAGVGLVVGLFAPALLASAAIGGAAGALAATFADHRLKTGLGDTVGRALAAGTAVVIAVSPAGSRLAVEQALGSSPMKSVAELDKSTLRGLKSALAEAMGMFNPDRSRLPLPDRNFGGVAGRTMGETVGDWTIVPGPKAAGGSAQRSDRVDRRRRVRRPRHLRRGDPHADIDPCRPEWLDLQQIPCHSGVLADPGGAADRTQPPPRRVWFDRGVPGSVSRLLVGQAAQLRRTAADIA